MVLRTLAAVPGALPAAPATKATELEFWRSIKDGNDPADFDLYVQQFPSGIYAALAKRRRAKLRGLVTEGDEAKAKQAQEQERREIEEAARREADARVKLAEEKAEMEAALAKREAEFQQREAALKKREAELMKKLDLARQREAEAKKSGDVGKQRELAELTRQREAAGQAAKRYGDMLQKGVPGVPRDYGEALRYYEIARLNGVDVPVSKSR